MYPDKGGIVFITGDSSVKRSFFGKFSPLRPGTKWNGVVFPVMEL